MDLTKIANCLHENIESRRTQRIEEIRKDEHDFFSHLRGMKLTEDQIYGVEWMSATYDLGLSCILGDEMGVGKTVQAICFLLRLCYNLE
jgi:SNF2 family DNA or RNA helicase